MIIESVNCHLTFEISTVNYVKKYKKSVFEISLEEQVARLCPPPTTLLKALRVLILHYLP